MSRRPELPPVTVREFARLTTSELPVSTLDRARISPTAFDWLCELSSRKNGQTGAQMLQVESRNWLQLDNHVGVLESPCGQRIEILPKHVEGGGPQTVRQSRSLLRRMLASALDLSPRETDEASLEQFDHPLTEWVMQRFLLALDQLVKRGMRRDYLRVEEMQPYLRGQLDMACQMRTPPGRAHLFSICHDVFSVDRPENRLLKSALSRVMYAAQEAENWRLASTLLCLLDEVPPSRDVAADFKAWRSDRLMAHYEPVRPWCELVLSHQVPLAVAGDTRGLSLMFPMEKLFERYVGRAVRSQLPSGYRLTEQAARHSLCTHDGTGFFRLRPDFLVEGDGRIWVLDAKWKTIDSARRDERYQMNQADFYQLHAYGHHYLAGHGELALIYPMTARFDRPLGPFRFSEMLSLMALPFDMEASRLQSLPWMNV